MIGKYERDEPVSVDTIKITTDSFEVSLEYLAGEGQNAIIDKMTVQRLQDNEAMNPTF